MNTHRDTRVLCASLEGKAAMAASSRNTQPWGLELGEDWIRGLPDFTRRSTLIDPDDHRFYASLGRAAGNMVGSESAQGFRKWPCPFLRESPPALAG